MTRKEHIIYNGKLHFSDEKIISPNNRSFKYGDGFFETMKMINGKIIFQDLHFERTFSSLQTMQFDQPLFFTTNYFLQQIENLVKANNHQRLARIRVNIFRGNGNIFDIENNEPNYVIQSWQLEKFPAYNEQGLTIDIYKGARKTCDAFSHIKSNNYLPYVMAALWCKKNSFDDALLMNNYDRITEATTSNIFIVKNGKVLTPALNEGCIAGVTRRYLLECFQKENIGYEEVKITIDDVLNADELFITNAGFYIRWIQQCSNKIYTNQTSKLLYATFINPLLKIKNE